MSGAKGGNKSRDNSGDETGDGSASGPQSTAPETTALFGAGHASVKKVHSESPANLPIYMAFLKPGDKVMGVALPMGGHHNRVPFATKKFPAPGIG